jgi:hypothetical protein
MLTSLPTAVKIEELDFNFQQASTTNLDVELTHLHKQIGQQDERFYKLATFLNE